MLNEKGLYVFEDISFVNTAEFTRTAQYFQKHGVYTHAPRGSRDHRDFWDIEEDRILNGMSMPGKLIVDDKGRTSIQDVHITGEHYSYLNYGRIKKVDRFEELDGVIKMTKKQKKSARKKLGFPDFWDGDYHYYKCKEFAKDNGLHLAVSKSRRKGFTYKEAFDVALSANFNPQSISIVGAYDYKYIKGEGQMMRFGMSYLDFFNDHTDFGRGYLNRTVDLIRLGYVREKDPQKIERGYLSSIIPISFRDNPKAAIGKDAVLLKLEEAGDFPNLVNVMLETLPTMKDGTIYTGFFVIFGATTDDVSNFEPFKEIYYNPKKFDCLAFENVWEDAEYSQGVGYFFPYAQNLVPDCVDIHGNSLFDKAAPIIEEEREKNKIELSPSEYLIYLSKYCNKPSEAFFTSGGGVLSSPELLTHIQDLETNPIYKSVSKAGFLTTNNKGNIVFDFEEPGTGRRPNPLFNYPLRKEDDTDGCFVEWFTPYRDVNGNIPDNLYIVVCDPFATNKEKGTVSLRNSLGAAYVYERPNNFTATKGDVIVASYVGRPLDTLVYSKGLFNMCKRWNAKLQFENDRGDIKPHAELLGEVSLLFEEPEFDFKKDLSGKTGRAYGTHMNTARIAAAIKYYYIWLHTKRNLQADGTYKLNLHYIYDIAALKETVNWNLKGNFDRVSAMLILMFQMKEMEILDIQQARHSQVEEDSYFNNFEMFS